MRANEFITEQPVTTTNAQGVTTTVNKAANRVTQQSDAGTTVKDRTGGVRSIATPKVGGFQAKQTFRPDATPGYQQATYKAGGTTLDMKGSPETGYTKTVGQSVGGTNTGGNGGDGVQVAITGSSVYYAGGGGGVGSTAGGTGGQGGGGAGARNNATPPTAGTVNTGGGAGGAGNDGAGVGSESGGSGVVILRYADTFDLASATTGSPTINTSGGYRFYTFTASGSITF